MGVRAITFPADNTLALCFLSRVRKLELVFPFEMRRQ